MQAENQWPWVFLISDEKGHGMVFEAEGARRVDCGRVSVASHIKADEGDPLSVRKWALSRAYAFVRVGQLGAEMQYQVHTDKESPSSLPFSATSLEPLQ